MSKKKIAVIFGGNSSEHDVSLESASYIIKNIPTSRYNVKMIGITKQGEWLLYEGDVDKIKTGEWEKSGNTKSAFISPDSQNKGLIVLNNDDSFEKFKLDAVFPVLHGKNGEDGSVQGLLQLANIPCVGSDLTSSAVCMDKTLTNILLDHAGIKQADFLWIYSYNVKNHMDICVTYIENNISGYPVFIKPAKSGSSVGISKVNNTKELRKALLIAANADNKILIEANINGREIECAVLGNEGDLEASVGGEIVSANEFYDYNAKYISESKLILPADLTEQQTNELIAIAKETYMLLGCSGLARVDFFLSEEGEFFVNEINTIPGFTSISMYPKLMEHKGIPIDQLLDRLISLAIEGAN